MTDNEIIKALEICILGDCSGCDCRCGSVGDCRDTLNKHSLDLITRQKEQIEGLVSGQETLQKYIAEKDAEIEKLQKENTELDGANILLTVTLKNAKSEAVKEFAERLKEKLVEESYDDCQFFKVVGESEIDNLVKEMVGEYP